MPRLIVVICAGIVATGLLAGFTSVMEAARLRSVPQAPLLALTETVEVRPTDTPPPTPPGTPLPETPPPTTPVQERQQTTTPGSVGTPTPTPTVPVPVTLPGAGASVASGVPLILVLLALLAVIGGLLARGRGSSS
ncbi:MAG: hypothetical protein J7455_13295 [Roseiflexus sp.]|nr:hypothetical protein [Roseiflexus sp.]